VLSVIQNHKNPRALCALRVLRGSKPYNKYVGVLAFKTVS
jgi:hypothetical protein